MELEFSSVEIYRVWFGGISSPEFRSKPEVGRFLESGIGRISSPRIELGLFAMHRRNKKLQDLLAVSKT